MGLLFTKTVVPMVVILVTWATPSTQSTGQRNVVRMQRTRLKLSRAIVIMLSSTTAMPRQNLGRIQFASQTWGRRTTTVFVRWRLPSSSFFVACAEVEATASESCSHDVQHHISLACVRTGATLHVGLLSENSCGSS